MKQILSFSMIFLMSSLALGKIARPAMVPTIDHPVPLIKLAVGGDEQNPGPIFPGEGYPGQPVGIPKISDAGPILPGDGYPGQPISIPKIILSLGGGNGDFPQPLPNPANPIGPIENPADQPLIFAKDPFGVGPAKDEWELWTSLADDFLSTDAHLYIVSESEKTDITDSMVEFSEMVLQARSDELQMILEENPRKAHLLKIVNVAAQNATL